jgi:non-heme chloroperoxidase
VGASPSGFLGAKERFDEHDHRWPGEQHSDRDLLRGPWQRLAGRAAERLATRQSFLGAAAAALLQAGHRVVLLDRRGFGQSSRPTEGYDFDTLASDLDQVLTELDLRDATLIGFSLGTGEVARYIGRYGTERLKACVFIESLAPSFVKSEENPKGVDQAGVDGVRQAILDDRAAWLTAILGDFLNLDEYLGKRVSKDTVHTMWNAGAGASPYATWACPLTWLDDYEEDIKRIDIPTLILQGTADRILSVEGQGRRLHATLPDAHYVEIEGGPHVMCVTHAAEVNRELLAFLGRTQGVDR